MNDNVKVEFSEPYSEEEHVGYTTDFSEWVNMLMQTSEKNNIPDYTILTNGKFVEFFRDASGFMLSPVAKRGSDILETRTYGFRSIDDLREKLDLEKIFVYQIIDASGKKIKREYNDEAQKLLFAKKEVPEHMMEYVENDYRIRYAVLTT